MPSRSTPTTGDVLGIDTTNAVGFSVDNGSLDLVIVKEVPPCATRTWTGIYLEVGVDGPARPARRVRAQRHRPDVRDELVRLTASPTPPAPSDTTRMNWNGVSPAGSAGIRREQRVQHRRDQVSGSLDLNISGFVLIAGTFPHHPEPVDECERRHGLSPTEASVLTISLTNIFVFAGVDGAFTATAPSCRHRPRHVECVGIRVLQRHASTWRSSARIRRLARGHPRKWIGVAASLAVSSAIVGLDPARVQLRGQELLLPLQHRRRAVTAARINWDGVSQVQGRGSNPTATVGDGLTAATELQVGGFLTITVSQFVFIAGAVVIEKRDLPVKTVGEAGHARRCRCCRSAATSKVFGGIGESVLGAATATATS